jgi:hypothetical protein
MFCSFFDAFCESRDSISKPVKLDFDLPAGPSENSSLSRFVFHYHYCRKNREADARGNHAGVDYRIHPTASFDRVLQVDGENRNSEYRCDNSSSSNRSHDCHVLLEIACGAAAASDIGFLLLKFTNLRHHRLLLGGFL